MTLLSSALHWNYIKTLTQTKKLPLRPDFITCRNVFITLKLCVPGGGIPAAHYRTTCAVSQRRGSASSGLWSRYAKKSKARDGRRSCPMFYSAFDSWRAPSGWTQREYQKGKIKKKRVDGLYSQCRRAADALKSHAACVARTKRSARTWKLLRLTPPTNGFQQLTSPLHHLGQTLKFLAKPWNTGKKKRKKDGNKFMSRASVRFAVHARVQRLKATERNNFSRGSQEIYRFRRAGCSIRRKVQSNGTALIKKKRRNHEYLTAHHISCVKCAPATPL